MRFGLVLALALTTLPVSVQAQEDTADAEAEAAAKRVQCEQSANLIGAVQQARLDRVRKARVADTVLAANPGLPDAVGTALPALVEYIYSIPRRDLKEQDLAATTLQQCLEQFEQAKELTGG